MPSTAKWYEENLHLYGVGYWSYQVPKPISVTEMVDAQIVACLATLYRHMSYCRYTAEYLQKVWKAHPFVPHALVELEKRGIEYQLPWESEIPF